MPFSKWVSSSRLLRPLFLSLLLMALTFSRITTAGNRNRM